VTLIVDSLGKTFDDERALVDVDLTVDDGEFVVVIGPSGCGKTTLLHCIAGLTHPDRGDVRRDGESLVDVPVREREFGVVFQDFEDRLFPHLTVAENVEFGLRQTGDYTDEEIQSRIDEVLELLAISGTRNDYPPTLSGGQQQRVELARQLSRDAETFLLDDPLSDLDYKLQKRLELELRRLHATDGDTILYVTHNQDQSLKLADRIVVMNRGTVEQIGSPTAVYREPKTAFVARFVGDSNLLVADVPATLDGDVTLVETPMGTVRARETPDAATTDDDSGRGGRDDGGAGGGRDGDDRLGAGVLVVRPENVGFGDGENTVSGVLEQRIYTGELTEFVVSLADGDHEFRTQEPGDVPMAAIDGSIGERVRISWDVDDTHYFGPGELSATGEFSAGDLEVI